MHDCMLAIVGGLSTVAADVTTVSLISFGVLKQSYENLLYQDEYNLKY